ncbi:MAG TPA: lactonase family protein [Chthoniobacteraceae bacterium]|jgi:6-phosphogluconolactonase|nr:lactonase family protein [Chthoniobacteraceae bacterium]
MKLAAALFCFLLPLAAFSAPERFYIGVYTGPGKGEGIYTCTLDSVTGRLGPVTLAIKANNPGYLALSPDGSHLYSVTSDDGGSAAAYSFGKNGTLTLLNHVSAGGPGTCHINVDAAGKNVLVANYSGGNIGCIHLKADGSLGARTSAASFTGSGPDPVRQTKSYAHFICTDAGSQFVYSCDLGSDHVWIYHFDADKGQFQALAGKQGIVPPGSGPRHLVFGPGQNFAYVNGEMGRNVTVFSRDKTTGGLTPVETLSLVPGKGPENGVTTAEIRRSGNWLYISSRGDDILAVFKIGADGKLTFIEDVPSLVKFPRGLNIDPTGHWLVDAGQNDGKIAVFSMDQSTGKLTATGATATAPSAVDVLFVPGR